jgi:hypothetical protein
MKNPFKIDEIYIMQLNIYLYSDGDSSILLGCSLKVSQTSVSYIVSKSMVYVEYFYCILFLLHIALLKFSSGKLKSNFKRILRVDINIFLFLGAFLKDQNG